MSLLLGSDLAAVSVEDKMYLYYQVSEGHVVEVSSSDGKSWSQLSTIASDITPNSSAFTAFACVKDATNGNKPSIHFIYMDRNLKLRELVRAVSEDTWKELKMPSGLPAPLETTKMASGVCHDVGFNEAHHWIYYSSLNSQGAVEIQELRKSVRADWVVRKDLPQAHGTALAGSAIAASLTNPTTFLLFQDYNKNVYRAEGGYEDWDPSKTKVVVQGADTIYRSPLASCMDSNEKYYLFFVKVVGGKNQISSLIDGKQTSIAVWTPGSFIGAVMHGDKPYLFVNEVAGAIPQLSTYVYDGSAFTSLGKVM